MWKLPMNGESGLKQMLWSELIKKDVEISGKSAEAQSLDCILQVLWA
jgi:hypothetical protein